MAPLPLTTEERHFGHIAALLAALLAAAALWMLFPEMAAFRPFSILLSGALAGLAWGALTAARSPREKRRSFASPLLALFLCSVLAAATQSLAVWASLLLLGIFVLSAIAYFRAAPGLSGLVAAPPALPDDAPAPAVKASSSSTVKLGVRPAPVKE